MAMMVASPWWWCDNGDEGDCDDGDSDNDCFGDKKCWWYQWQWRYCVNWWLLLKKEFKHQGREWMRKPIRSLSIPKMSGEKSLQGFSWRSGRAMSVCWHHLHPLLTFWEFISPERTVEIPPGSASGPGSPDPICAWPCASHILGSSGNSQRGDWRCKWAWGMHGEEQRLSPLLTFPTHPHCNHPAQVMVRDPWNHEKT